MGWSTLFRSTVIVWNKVFYMSTYSFELNLKPPTIFWLMFTCVPSYTISPTESARPLLVPPTRGGNKIWIFKPQVNFDVIPTYKHGGKWFFEFGGHLNPPHLRWSFRFFGDFRPFQRNLYIFINAGLEPKLFEIKSSTQQQSCKAHKIGQFCHQDQPSICLCSRLRNNSLPASSKMVEGRQWQILQIWLISTSPNPQTARLEH